MFIRSSSNGCLISIVAGLLLGGGFAGLGYALGWMGSAAGLVIGGAGLITIVGIIGVAALFNNAAKPEPGTIVLEGSVLSGPGDQDLYDFTKPYELMVWANAEKCLLVLRLPSLDDLGAGTDETGRQLVKKTRPGLRLQLDGVSVSRLQTIFDLPAYVDPVVPAGGIALAANDPRQQPLIDALLLAMGHHRDRNTRYSAFAALPWQQTAAPSSTLLRDVALALAVEPAAAFAALPENIDPADPRAVVAQAFGDVRLWLDQRLGVTPDYVLVDAYNEHGLTGNQREHSFTLIPLGPGRCTARRDMFRRMSGGGSAMGAGSLTYAALVIEAPDLAEPVWTIFDEMWETADHELDAVVAFINRP